MENKIKSKTKKWKKPIIKKVSKKIYLAGCGMADDSACPGGPIDRSE